MDKLKRLFFVLLFVVSCFATRAQYYHIADHFTDVILPPLSFNPNYKGFVDASYMKGVGSLNADFVEISTTQGFSLFPWFYVGAGTGIDLLFTKTIFNESSVGLKKENRTEIMIPLFSDFRFNIGNKTKTSFFIDLKIGGIFLVSSDYVEINDGALTSEECFYLKPSVGVRIPINKNRPKSALNVALSYQFISTDFTRNLWYDDYYDTYMDNVSLSGLGVTVGFEW